MLPSVVCSQEQSPSISAICARQCYSQLSVSVLQSFCQCCSQSGSPMRRALFLRLSFFLSGAGSSLGSQCEVHVCLEWSLRLLRVEPSFLGMRDTACTCASYRDCEFVQAMCIPSLQSAAVDYTWTIRAMLKQQLGLHTR